MVICAARPSRRARMHPAPDLARLVDVLRGLREDLYLLADKEPPLLPALTAAALAVTECVATLEQARGPACDEAVAHAGAHLARLLHTPLDPATFISVRHVLHVLETHLTRDHAAAPGTPSTLRRKKHLRLVHST